mmetsp:Transcript_8736/g.16023  ORF Transcript_8736/g.16023 Transcript_8736/m.16023 type:complete len:377 (-) Transcript_8736:264-1394(-)
MQRGESEGMSGDNDVTASRPIANQGQAKGAGHLGDVLAARDDGTWNFLQSENARQELGPLERLMTTANGNLQRIVSSWTNRDVSVKVLKNDLVESSPEQVYHRLVKLECDEIEFGTADSTVTLSDPRLKEAAASGRVGLGQLLREFNLLPAFHLEMAKVHPGGTIERQYKLQCTGMILDIHEVLIPSRLPPPLVEKKGPKEDNASCVDRTQRSHFGDVMKGTSTSVHVPALALSPFQRVLCTANGNVKRLLESVKLVPVQVRIVEAARMTAESPEATLFERQIELVQSDAVSCTAKSIVKVFDKTLVGKIISKEKDLGAIFGSPGEKDAILPKFELLSVDLDPSDAIALSRTYRLSTSVAEFVVTEHFPRTALPNV